MQTIQGSGYTSSEKVFQKFKYGQKITPGMFLDN